MKTEFEGVERREYFRIDDQVYLEFRPVGAGELESLAHRTGEAGDLCSLVLQLSAMASQASNLLAIIRKEQPEIGHYLGLLDRKIELVASAVVGANLRDLTPNRLVNLSAGGIAFDIESPLQDGMSLALKLVCFPSRLCISTLGRVVYCRPGDSEGQWRVGIAFTDLDNTARDALVRHTLERQSAQLRERRGRTP